MHRLQYENITSDAYMVPALRDIKRFLAVRSRGSMQAGPPRAVLGGPQSRPLRFAAEAYSLQARQLPALLACTNAQLP